MLLRDDAAIIDARRDAMIFYVIVAASLLMLP